MLNIRVICFVLSLFVHSAEYFVTHKHEFIWLFPTGKNFGLAVPLLCKFRSLVRRTTRRNANKRLRPMRPIGTIPSVERLRLPSTVRLRGQHSHGGAGASHRTRVLVHGRVLLLPLRGLLPVAAAQQVPVVVETELLAEEVERQRVDARVDEGHAEADDLEDVPEEIVEARVEVVPHDVDVTRQPAHDEDAHERQHDLRHFLTGLHLPLLLVRHLPLLKHKQVMKKSARKKWCFLNAARSLWYTTFPAQIA